MWFKFAIRFKNYFGKWKKMGTKRQRLRALNIFFSLEMEFDFIRADCNTICLNPGESYKLIT